MSDLWGGADPATRDDEVSAWLESRGLDPDLVELHDLARALPQGTAPGWCRCRGRTWEAAGYRLLVPMFGATGRMESVQARAVRDPGDGMPKGANPAGASVAGLVFANPLAQLWLAGLGAGARSDAAALVASVGLVVAEGVPDFLTWASDRSDADDSAPAVIGVANGSWRDGDPAGAAFARAVPSDTRVVLATHYDDDGDAYARRIFATLEDRARNGDVDVRRWTQGRTA